MAMNRKTVWLTNDMDPDEPWLVDPARTDNDPMFCVAGIREFFDVPEKAKRMRFYLSRKPSPGSQQIDADPRDGTIWSLSTPNLVSGVLLDRDYVEQIFGVRLSSSTRRRTYYVHCEYEI